MKCAPWRRVWAAVGTHGLSPNSLPYPRGVVGQAGTAKQDGRLCLPLNLQNQISTHYKVIYEHTVWLSTYSNEINYHLSI